MCLDYSTLLLLLGVLATIFKRNTPDVKYVWIQVILLLLAWLLFCVHSTGRVVLNDVSFRGS